GGVVQGVQRPGGGLQGHALLAEAGAGSVERAQHQSGARFGAEGGGLSRAELTAGGDPVDVLQAHRGKQHGGPGACRVAGGGQCRGRVVVDHFDAVLGGLTGGEEQPLQGSGGQGAASRGAVRCGGLQCIGGEAVQQEPVLGVGGDQRGALLGGGAQPLHG